jgi:hypothetical protein
MKKKIVRKSRPIDDAKLIAALTKWLTAAQAAKAMKMDTPYGIAKIRTRLDNLVLAGRKVQSQKPSKRTGPGRIPVLYRAR